MSYPFRSLETWQDLQRKEKLVVGVVRWNILVARILYEIKKNSLSIYLYNTFIHNLFCAHMSHVLINRGMHRYLVGAVYVLKEWKTDRGPCGEGEKGNPDSEATH